VFHEYIRGVEVITPPFLTSAVDGGECSASRLGSFTPGERTLRSEPVWTLWRRENLSRVGIRISAVELVARRYTRTD
jgi:hypothetical protein